MKYRKVFLITISILMFGVMTLAAPCTQAFSNDFQTDSTNLFLTEGNIEFDKWQKVPENWEAGNDQADIISISGPMIDTGERFRIKFIDIGTYTLEWAELFNGVIQRSGSLFALF